MQSGKSMYAPIIIPTLNRYEHLRECLESLKKNKHANETEVFISVDYPPSSIYEEGYGHVKNYLSSGVEGFKKVNVIYQQENLGEFRNIDYLISCIRGSYDRFIFTEDDNIFSENFLEYMNRCLEVYKNDDSIYAICGYMWPVDNMTDRHEVVKINSIFSAWGYGAWLEKIDKLNRHINLDELEIIMNDKKMMMSLRKTNRFIYVELIKGFLGITNCLIKDENVEKIDLAYSVWMYANNLSMLYPVCSKVRNIGNDGSGQNCVDLDEEFADAKKVNNRNYNYSKQTLDNESYFDEPLFLDKDCAVELETRLMRFLTVSHNELFKSDLAYVLYRVMGRKKVISIMSKIAQV